MKSEAPILAPKKPSKDTFQFGIFLGLERTLLSELPRIHDFENLFGFSLRIFQKYSFMSLCVN